MREPGTAVGSHNDQVGVYFLGKAQNTIFFNRIVVNVQGIILNAVTVYEILHAVFAGAGSTKSRWCAHVNQVYVRIEKVLEIFKHIYHIRAVFPEIRRENNGSYLERSAWHFNG